MFALDLRWDLRLDVFQALVGWGEAVSGEEIAPDGAVKRAFGFRKYCRREVLEENVIDAEMLKRINFFRCLAREFV